MLSRSKRHSEAILNRPNCPNLTDPDKTVTNSTTSNLLLHSKLLLCVRAFILVLNHHITRLCLAGSTTTNPHTRGRNDYTTHNSSPPSQETQRTLQHPTTSDSHRGNV